MPNRIDLRFKREIFFGDTAAAERSCYIYRLAHEIWGDRFVAERGGDRPGVLMFVARGRGELLIDGQREMFGRGCVVAFGCGREHRLSVPPGATLEHRIVALRGRAAAETLREHMGDVPRVLRPRNAAALEGMVRQILAQAEEGGPLSQEIANALLHPLLLMIRQGMLETSSPGDAGDDAAQRVFLRCRARIECNFAAMASASEAAEREGIGQTYLCQLFRRFADTTPHAFLLRLKMSYAEHLLLSTDATLAEIAETLGFADAYSLSKTFKRVMGTTPRSVRTGR